ncbi:MAG: aminomethyl transferase family protein [Halobacteriales archaeon]
MSQSLEAAIQSAGSPVELMRDLGVGRFTDLPDEYTHWIEEQLSWKESVALADQSYHMTDLHVEGPDAIDLYAEHAVNSFEGFEPGKAKQLVVANPRGEFIGDSILFYLEEDRLLSVGAAAANNWVDYHASTGDEDVESDFQPRPVTMDDDPTYFRYQVQGPDAVDTMADAADEPLPELGFFNFEPITVDGYEVNLLRHGMAGEAGYEFWGPYEYGDAVKEAVLEAGEAYDIHRLGAESYQTANVLLGWLPLPIPAIYTGEELQDYREWLSARRGILSIGGSFASDDISDYYVTPVELGYDRVINFDHDFVGREALEAEIENPQRRKVTLVWDGDDVVDVYGSLFSGGDTYQYMELPHPRSSACPYDRVEVDGELVGVSTDKSYVYQERSMLSLAVLDTDYAEPGTEVTVIWGEPADNENPRAERHVQTAIDATVAPAPYSEDNR